MNEHYRAFIDFGRRLADEHGDLWNVRLQDDGVAVAGFAWNLTELVGDSPPPIHWIRDFGLDTKALRALNAGRAGHGLPAIQKQPLSTGWLDFLKAAIMEQIFLRRNSTGHVMRNVARPLRVLATSAFGREPWELRADDVARAVELARDIQASGKLADLVLGLVKTLVDANHIADVGPLFATLIIPARSSRNKRSRFTRSADELRADLTARKDAEKLPERRAFWELVRIVFTERPQSLLDRLRFTLVQVMLLCGLRVGEVCRLPADWKRTRDYYDASGRKAGELGGYSRAILLRHFAEKQQSPTSDSVALFETTQYVPRMFEEILEGTLEEMLRITQPLRHTLRCQVEQNRLLPWFGRDQIVSAIELYPHITGNPIVLKSSDDEQREWQSAYRERFDSEVLDAMLDDQLRRLRTGAVTLAPGLYMYYNRLKGKVTFRKSDGSEWRDARMKWSEVFVTVGEMEDYLAEVVTKLPDRSPLRLSPSGDIKAWELLFLMPKRALAEGRNDGLCDVNRYYSIGRAAPELIQLALGRREGTSGPTLFEAYGDSSDDRALTLNTHALRHLQNTELFRLGIADTIITKRFNRKSVAQSYAYDHRSLSEDLEHVDLPAEVEVALGSKAATVARMIKAGKAAGPIVDSFKRIQAAQGDDAAFEFLKVEADGFHSTPYGHCINSFTVDPCPQHLECFSGCRHLTATGLEKHRRNLSQLESRFSAAVQIIETRPNTTIGRDNQLRHAKGRLEAVRRILVTPEGTRVFPDGEDLSIADRGFKSVLDV